MRVLLPGCRVLVVFAALGLFALPTRSAAEEPTAPSTLIEALETPTATGGVMDEADASEAQAGDPDSGLTERERDRVEEIVVTARKRTELLEDTPVSVTALSENLLREANVNRFSEIESLVPNMEFLGSNSNGRVLIRGVGQATTGAAFDSGVGVYIDGIFLPRSQVLVFDVVDVAAIEVLRGPQGTLFGKNTIGGAVNVTTQKPSGEPEAFAMVRAGNFANVETRAMLNIPIDIGWFEDRLATRIAFASENSNGYTNTLFRDPETGDTEELKTGGVANLSFLGSLRLQVLEDLVLDVSGAWLENRASFRGLQCVPVQETGLGNLPPGGYYEACNETAPYDYSVNRKSTRSGRNWGTWGTLTWSPGELGVLEDVDLKYIGSWRRQTNRSVVDMDSTAEDVLTLASDGAGPGYLLGEPGRSQQVQQELQLNASAWEGRFNFVSGAFGFWETASRDNATVVPRLPQLTLNSTDFRNWTWALYGQGTLDVTEWLGLTVGLRYTQDKKGAYQLNRRMDDAGEITAITKQTSGRKVFEAWTPMASLAATLPESYLEDTQVDHLMAYFTWSQGFKGGGFNAVINPSDESNDLLPFGPETLDNFEVGLKTVALDRTLTMNLSFFTALYKDIQVRTFQPVFDDQGELETLLSLTLNAAAAVNRGAEFDFNWRPVRGLRLEGSVGLLDARYTDFPVAISERDGETINRSGERLPAATPVQTYFAMQYSMPIEGAWAGGMRGWLTPRFDWAYRSTVNWIGPELPEAIQPAYHTIGARLSYDFMDDQAQFALWARNLTDKRVTTAGTSLVSFFGVYGRPWEIGRTFGAEFSWSFR